MGYHKKFNVGCQIVKLQPLKKFKLFSLDAEENQGTVPPLNFSVTSTASKIAIALLS